MSEAPILVSCRLLPKLSHPTKKNTVRTYFPLHSIEAPWYRYTYLETITRERMVQSVPSFFFVCCCCSLTLCVVFFFKSPKTKSQAKWACLTLFFKHFFRKQSASRDPFLRNVWRKKCCLSVCGFIGHDEGWYYGGCCCCCGCEMRKDPICLTLA